jgi:hypothetical protein
LKPKTGTGEKGQGHTKCRTEKKKGQSSRANYYFSKAVPSIEILIPHSCDKNCNENRKWHPMNPLS